MKALGIDYGEKRIGLAVSDETQTFARELEILSPHEFDRRIHSIISEHEVDVIVLGWPLNMNGQETKKTKEVESFKQKLIEKTGLRVEIMDERLSSVMAQKLPGGQKNIDSLAAQILLQNYLDRNKH